MNTRIRNNNFIKVKGTNHYGIVISTDPKKFRHVVKFIDKPEPYYHIYFEYELEKISDNFLEDKN